MLLFNIFLLIFSERFYLIHATYDIDLSYEDNYINGPKVNFNIPKKINSSSLKIWDYEVNSPVGIPAGPLHNSKYILCTSSSLAFCGIITCPNFPC